MRREDIPARLRVARPADCRRIPLAALKSMQPADVAPRLSAADEFRRRARVPHLDGDLMSYRLGLASEVLATADPKRAAALIKAAGITPGQRPAAASGPLAKSPARAARQPAARQVGDIVTYPVVNLLEQKANKAMSASTALIEMANEGRLGALEADIARMRRDVSSGRVMLTRPTARTPAAALPASSPGAAQLAKAERYERQAARMTDPADRRGYLELARAERDKAGAA